MINYQYNDKLLKNSFLRLSPQQKTLDPSRYQFNDIVLYDEKRERIIKTAIWSPINHFDSPHPLILFSHGAKGNRFNHCYLTEFLATHGYIIAAVEHADDNSLNHTDSSSIKNLWHRPLDIKFAINALLTEQKSLLPIDQQKIGYVGFSFGGYTGLALAGATPHFKRLKNFIPLENKQELPHHHLFEPRITAYTLMAPALSLLFDPQDLQAISSPLLLCLSGKDEFLSRDNTFYSTHLFSTVYRIAFKQAGHYIYLMPKPAHIKNKKHASFADIGSKREWVHPILKKHLLTFFAERWR